MKLIAAVKNLQHAVSTRFLASLVALGILAFTGTAQADTIRIVALGASNFAGKGVSSSEAWPAQLEAMLRAKGYDAQVTNAGVNGDTTAGMLARVNSAVPDGTALVILGKPTVNDVKKGMGGGAANIAAIVGILRSRHIKEMSFSGEARGIPLQADNEHFTAAGHATVAARLLPRVIAAIRKR